MSLITKDNYEAYLLDYVEENLSPELIAELMLFLENNPALKEELDDFEIQELLPLEITLTNKEDLKKNEGFVTLNNYEEAIIAEIEGENTPEVSVALHLFLERNSEKQSDFITYQKTKLVASSILFDDKKSLKKKEGKVIPMYWWYTSAAAVILILFFLNVFNNGGGQSNHPIADQLEVTIPKQKVEELVTPNEVFIEENEIAVVEDEKVSPRKNHQKKKKEKISDYVPQKIEEESPVLAETPREIKELIIDSLPAEIINEYPVEEIQYADNVKITYEDVIADNTIDSKSEYKTVGQIISQPFKKRFVAIFGSTKSSN